MDGLLLFSFFFFFSFDFPSRLSFAVSMPSRFPQLSFIRRLFIIGRILISFSGKYDADL